MRVTNGLAIVYNRARRAKQGGVLRPPISWRRRNPVNFEFDDKVKDLRRELQSFLDEHVYPNEQRFHDEIEHDRWKPTRIVEELKPRARAAGLWNLFLPNDEMVRADEPGVCTALRTHGAKPDGPEVFNCSAPDTGNMEVLARYGPPEQKERWLEPLLPAKSARVSR